MKYIILAALATTVLAEFQRGISIVAPTVGTNVTSGVPFLVEVLKNTTLNQEDVGLKINIVSFIDRVSRPLYNGTFNPTSSISSTSKFQDFIVVPPDMPSGGATVTVGHYFTIKEDTGVKFEVDQVEVEVHGH
ncbi:unnamed protein product [Somion occarium]|uniref:Uncharacterized protein n=1 Tax=Somion occarium TaxID=3059160 RepID=A0ABP1DY37_9APHY